MWLPFIIATFAFSWTAGVTHVIDAVQHGTFAVNNAGPIMYWDFVAPIVLLWLFLIQGGRLGADSSPARLTWAALRRRSRQAGCG